MASKAIALLAVVNAVLAQQPASPDADMDAALGSDDTCGAFGEEAAVFALNALQRRASEVDAAAVNDGMEQDACDKGLVGQVKAFAPKCVSACPQACGPLGKAIDAYLGQGGRGPARREVCHYKHQFACAYAHWSVCQPLVSKAASFGFKLPVSSSELVSECS
mmetsp:Transcript_36227/g.109536  ORF Transcript_36227/g.109536 Transcript_36227/m.109536 type:complete len:163 (-) Transcript_36227:194-682(-)